MPRLLLSVCAVFLLSGCGPAILPLDTPGAVVNLKERSITHRGEDLQLTLRLRDFEYPPYSQVNTIAAFHLSVVNISSEVSNFPITGLVLVDGTGRQYTPVSPDQIEALVKQELPYLIPYPYVGYYYLEDAQRGSWFNTFASSLPFYASRYPQDIHTEALPLEPILPGNRIAGLIYFVADLRPQKRFELRFYRDGVPAARTPEMLFPFAVEK